MAFVPSVFGMTAASVVVDKLTRGEQPVMRGHGTRQAQAPDAPAA